MKLASILTKERILLSMDAVESQQAIEELVHHLAVRELLGEESPEDILSSLQAREEQISTGIGSGVAIPHTFSDKIDEVSAVFGRSKKGINFDAIDNAPVKFILLFIVPQKDYHLHLQALSAIAKMFNNCEIRQQLADAIDAEEILEIFASRPSRTHSNHISQRLTHD